MPAQIRVRRPQVEDRLPEDLHPLLRRIYLNRGVGESSQLDLSLRNLLPFEQLKGIDAATALLQTAIETQQHILIVGDFDADGATSTALAMRALAQFGAQHVSYIVPDRFRYGYGLTPEIVQVALTESPDLIVTVDNGISSLAGVQRAREAGVKVLITDHHLPGAELPMAEAIVNPNQPGCAFASKKLAGVGVIFYVMAALRARLRKNRTLPDPDWSLAELLDLVALGTVADVVPLDYNNRILVQQGLLRMRAGRCCAGIKALLDVAGRDLASISSTDLGFAVGPRLNAAGRMQDMSIGIECLLCKDAGQAHALAAQLDVINRERRERQVEMQEAALDGIESRYSEDELPMGLCVYEPDWHEGIVGLVASRLKERHHRPCIAFAPTADGRSLKGSARSIPGLHIRDCLDRVATDNPGLITKFGGHAMAAGLSLAADQLDAFDKAFNKVLTEELDAQLLEAVQDSDGELEPSELNLDTAMSLSSAGPWGQGFPPPVFHGCFSVIEQRVLKDRHLKLRLQPAGLPDSSPSIDAIAFNAVEDASQACAEQLRVSYRLEVNEFRGRVNPQLLIEQFHE